MPVSCVILHVTGVPPPAKIYGYVTDATSGDIIVGATVTCDTTGAYATSDIAGYYELDPLMSGIGIPITCTAPGTDFWDYVPQTQYVDFDGITSVPLDFQMVRSVAVAPEISNFRLCADQPYVPPEGGWACNNPVNLVGIGITYYMIGRIYNVVHVNGDYHYRIRMVGYDGQGNYSGATAWEEHSGSFGWEAPWFDFYFWFYYATGTPTGPNAYIVFEVEDLITGLSGSGASDYFYLTD